MTRRSARRTTRNLAGLVRNVALIGGAAALIVGTMVGLPWLARNFIAGEFEFEPLVEPPGFRRIVAGEFSGSADVLAGMPGASPGPSGSGGALQGDGLCRALFGPEAADAAVVPIAYFNDYLCPSCRDLSGRLEALAAERLNSVHVVWHEWPVLGEPSEVAARAALAAKRQGAYAEFRDQLGATSVLPTPAYLRRLAERIGVDPERLVLDMDGDGVARELDEARALARLFRFPGTPGLVIGRTVVIGAIAEADLEALVEREVADGPVEACLSDQRGG